MQLCVIPPAVSPFQYLSLGRWKYGSVVKFEWMCMFRSGGYICLLVLSSKLKEKRHTELFKKKFTLKPIKVSLNIYYQIIISQLNQLFKIQLVVAL